jgi:hypothetical protein
MFKRGDYLRAIADGMSRVERTCELQGILRLFDDHVLAERFFCRLLDSAYRIQLKRMEEIQSNHPAFDLGDAQTRVAYQITTEKSSEKVQRTLDKFVEKGFEKQYHRLCILIIGNRQTTYKSVTVPPELQFNCARDIIGIPELIKHIDTLNSRRLRELSNIFKEELGPIEEAIGSKNRLGSVRR